MNMDRHISHICQTAYFQLRKVAAIRPFLTHAAAETLIHSLITSRLDFCNSLLAGLPSSSLNRLQGCPKCCRTIANEEEKVWSYHTHIDGTPLATSQEKDTIQGSPTDVQGQTCTTGHLAIYHPSLKNANSVQACCTSGLSLRVPSTRLKTYGWPCIFGRCSRLWNSLPVILRQLDDLETFKADLKTHLFRQMWN